MKNGTRGIEKYEKGSATQRISFLCDNFTVMEPMIRNYREDLITEVMEQKANGHRGEDEGLGVRIQVAFCRRNDPTANKAINRMEIAKAIDEGYLDENFFDGTDDREELIRKVTCYHLANAGYQRFVAKLKEMKPRDREIFLPYVRKEKSIEDLADEMQIQYESVVRKICRIKEQMREEREFMAGWQTVCQR